MAERRRRTASGPDESASGELRPDAERLDVSITGARGLFEMAEPPKARARPYALHLLELTALVAAAALTFVSPAIMRAIVPPADRGILAGREFLAHLAALVVIWWTAAFVPLALWVPGPAVRRVFRNYGRAAILASTTTLLFLVFEKAPSAVLPVLGVGFSTGWLYFLLDHAPVAAGAAVVAVWTILAFTGIGRRPSNWLDRLGCVVGWTWIVLGILVSIVWIVPISWLSRIPIAW
jgi:hypothetical protein